MADASAAGPLSGVWGQGDRVFGGLGAHWGGSWGHISEQNGGLEDTGGETWGVWRDLEGPRGSKASFLIDFRSHI